MNRGRRRVGNVGGVTLEALTALKGVGPTLARAVLESCPSTRDDLMRIRGVSQARAERIADLMGF